MYEDDVDLFFTGLKKSVVVGGWILDCKQTIPMSLPVSLLLNQAVPKW